MENENENENNNRFYEEYFGRLENE